MAIIFWPIKNSSNSHFAPLWKCFWKHIFEALFSFYLMEIYSQMFWHRNIYRNKWNGIVNLAHRHDVTIPHITSGVYHPRGNLRRRSPVRQSCQRKKNPLQGKNALRPNMRLGWNSLGPCRDLIKDTMCPWMGRSKNTTVPYVDRCKHVLNHRQTFVPNSSLGLNVKALTLKNSSQTSL